MFLFVLSGGLKLPGNLHSGKESRAQHDLQTGVQCPHCPAILMSNTYLHVHITQEHRDCCPFKCLECGRGYLSKGGLCLHLASHKGKSYECPICSLKFGQKGNAKRHLLRSHGCAQCPNCLETLNLGDAYDRHVLHCQKI